MSLDRKFVGVQFGNPTWVIPNSGVGDAAKKIYGVQARCGQFFIKTVSEITEVMK